MQIFNLTLSQMLMIFSLMLLGFILRKKTNIPENAGTVLAKLETFIFVPALSLFTQMTKCTIDNFKENAKLMLYGLIIIVVSVIASYPLSKLFVRKSENVKDGAYMQNVYKYALAFGNYGFMGNFIVLGVWGTDMFYKYSLFLFFVVAFCSSWGLYILIPKEQNVGILANLKKGLLTPPIIALVLGMVIGLSGITKYVPQFMLSAIESAGDCQGPVAMVLAGFVIGGYNFKKLVLNKKVYFVTLLRLIILPAIMMLVMKLLGAGDELMTLALIAFATPIGLNTIVYPAAYGGDTETGASMTMISHILSVATIPLMYLLFIVVI